MASINEAGRSRPSAQTEATDLDRVAGKGADRKNKGNFAALKGRKGVIENTAHASRSTSKEQGTVDKIEQDFRKKLGELEISKRIAGRGGGGMSARPEQRKGWWTKQSSAKAPPEAPAKDPTLTPVKPDRGTLARPSQAKAQAAPPETSAPAKPERAKTMARQAPAKPMRAPMSTMRGQTLGRPAKPDRSNASLQGGTMPRRSGEVPQPLPRTRINIATGDRPIPAARNKVVPSGDMAGATKASIYGTPSNVKVEEKPQVASRTTAPPPAAPRATLRSPADDKFLQGGGFNPTQTLGRGRGNMVRLQSPMASTQSVMAERQARVRTPAPPRLSLGRRILDAIKRFFHIGNIAGRATVVDVTPRASAVLKVPKLTEDSQLFSQDTNDHLKRSEKRIEGLKLSASDADSYAAAVGIIGVALKNTSENVLPSGDYHHSVGDRVFTALATIDKIVASSSGAPRAKSDITSEFPITDTAPEHYPDDRIYETLAEAQGTQGPDERGGASNA